MPAAFFLTIAFNLWESIHWSKLYFHCKWMLYRIANWLLPTYIVLNWIYIFKKKITEVYSNWDNLLKLKVIHRIQKRISKFFYKLRTSLVCFFCCYQQYKNIIWNSCLDPVNNLFISKIVWTLLFILFSTKVNFPKISRKFIPIGTTLKLKVVLPWVTHFSFGGKHY